MRALTGGGIAGLIGGVALWVWSGVASLLHGTSFWPVLKGTARPFFDPQRMSSSSFDFWPVVIGGAGHLIIAAGWGVFFALMFYGLSKGLTVFAGLFWGLVAWVTMYYVILPLVGLSQLVHAIPVGGAILSHLFFGLVLALGFLPFQRRWPRAWAPDRGPVGAHDVPLTP
jgi:hypothetical protein